MARSPEEVDTILRKTVAEAGKHFPVDAAYLFGSYANGTATDESDIDIALFSSRADEMKPGERGMALGRIRLAVGAEIELHLFSDKSLSQARPSNIFGLILKTGRKIT